MKAMLVGLMFNFESECITLSFI